MPRPILETLHHLEGGCFLNEAADKLSELIAAVDTTGKPGKLTLTINIRKATGVALAVKGKVTAAMPPEAPLEALLFPTPDGNLLTEDPRQGKLPLAAAPAPAETLPIAKTA